MSWLFASGGQSMGASILASVIPVDYSVLISFRINWFISLQPKGTLKSLLEHYSSKASTLQPSAFFMVQLSHPYVMAGKTIALTIWTFVSKVMSLLFNMLSRFAIAFLPRNKHLLISWLQSPSAVISEPKKIKSVIVSFVSPSIFHEVMGPNPIIFIFWIRSHKAYLFISWWTLGCSPVLAIVNNTAMNMSVQIFPLVIYSEVELLEYMYF